MRTRQPAGASTIALAILAAICVTGCSRPATTGDLTSDIQAMRASEAPRGDPPETAPADEARHGGQGEGETVCSVESCATGLSEDGYAFEWDGNGNGIPEIYAIDALRDDNGQVTGFHLYTTCEMDYDGTISDARSIERIEAGSDGHGRLMSVTYRKADGSERVATIRVVGDNIRIEQE